MELWRRQHKASEIGDDDRKLHAKKVEAEIILKAEDGVLHVTGKTGHITEATGRSCILPHVYGGGNLPEATVGMQLEEDRRDVKAPSHGACRRSVLDAMPLCAPASTPVGGNHLEQAPSTKAGASLPGAFPLLEAGLRTRHGWLCTNAFRLAVAGLDGDGRKGFPAKPRELTFLLSILGEFVSKLLQTT